MPFLVMWDRIIEDGPEDSGGESDYGSSDERYGVQSLPSAAAVD
jgi:hypothetical protein